MMTTIESWCISAATACAAWPPSFAARASRSSIERTWVSLSILRSTCTKRRAEVRPAPLPRTRPLRTSRAWRGRSGCRPISDGLGISSWEARTFCGGSPICLLESAAVLSAESLCSEASVPFQPMRMGKRMILMIVLMVAFSVTANLLLKADTLITGQDLKLFGIWGWRTIAGAANFALAFLCYTMLLRYVPLSVAQSFAALQFVAIILASRLVLGEDIGLMRWMGIATIVAGIAIVTREGF